MIVKLMKLLFGWDYAWVQLGDEVAYCRIKRLQGMTVAKMYGNWKIIGQSYVQRIVQMEAK